MASEHLAELEKYKLEIEVKLKEYHNIEHQKTDLERHVQSLIKVNVNKKLFVNMKTVFRQGFLNTAYGIQRDY